MADEKLTHKSQEAWSTAQRRAAADGSPQIEALHLLVALAEQVDGLAGQLLQAVGTDPALIAKQAEDRLAPDGGEAKTVLAAAGVTADALLEAFEQIRGSARVTSPDPEDTFKALEKYGIDLTKMARDSKLDPVIGRDAEIRRVIQVLSRRTKN